VSEIDAQCLSVVVCHLRIKARPGPLGKSRHKLGSERAEPLPVAWACIRAGITDPDIDVSRPVAGLGTRRFRGLTFCQE